MFNVRLKLRKAEEFVTPKGPNFFWARTIRTDVEGTKLSLKLPKHNPEYRGKTGGFPKRKYLRNHLQFLNYFCEEKANVGLKDHFREADLIYNSWAFFGPWFTGALAELVLTVRVVKIVKYPEGVSLFHPRAFEQVIADHLSDIYAKDRDYSGDEQAYHGPYEWKPLGEHVFDGVRLVIRPLPHDVTAPSPHYHCYFPIARDLMVSMLFRPSRLRPLPRAELDKMVAEQPMLDLMEKIIDSFSITLSEEAQTQRDAALEGVSDTSLVKDFPMMKWDDSSPEEFAKVIEKGN